MSRRTTFGIAAFLLVAVLILWLFSSHRDSAEPAVRELPTKAAPRHEVVQAPGPAAGEALVEGPSEDPLVTRLFDPGGNLSKTIRRNPQGQPIAETEYKDGQETKIERVYSESGQLLRERRLRNGTVLKDDKFR